MEDLRGVLGFTFPYTREPLRRVSAVQKMGAHVGGRLTGRGLIEVD